MKRFVVLLILLSAAGEGVFGEPQNTVAVNTVPYGTIPLGSSADLFNIGGGVRASAAFMPGALKVFGVELGADFFMLPLESANSIWSLAGYAGPALRFPIGDRVAIHAQGRIGYYYWGASGWDAAGTNGGGLVAGGGAGASVRIAGPFALGLGVSYDYYAKLYNGFGFSLAIRLDFPLTATRPLKKPAAGQKPKEAKPQPLEEKGKGVELRDISLSPLFPVLYKYYDNNPVGSARIRNFGDEPAENIRVLFFVERYMDNPMEAGPAFDLKPGEEKRIDLFGLFTEDLMEITEGTKASAKITISYIQGKAENTKDYTPVLEFHNRNALTWDDDRKIASFVTAKDPEILQFAKNVSNWMQDAKNPAVDENLQKGMAVFEALKAYGVRYEVDPSTPFSELSGQKTVIDFLQFPRQTLQFSNGDCDDLSALYTSLLEAVGVETSVITIPGHIYAAFALKAGPEEARKAMSRPDELIFREGKAWVPVEITMFQDTFEKAWAAGAKEWRENEARDQAKLYPTRESWKTFQAVGFAGGSGGIKLPGKEAVTGAFKACVLRHVEREIYPQVAQIQSKLQGSNEPHKYENKLAVLYARYGLYDQALERLTKLLAGREYEPALVNVGNIYFLKSEYESACAYYQRALTLDAGDATALLGAARCNHELENYGLVSRIYQQLKAADPDLALRYAYLDLKGEEAARAADAAGLRRTVVWEEE